jgi:hypothetical protein
MTYDPNKAGASSRAERIINTGIVFVALLGCWW